MSQHIHSTAHVAHVMAPVVAFLQRQEAIQQGNQEKAQLEAIIAELHLLPDYQRARQQGAPAINLQELDSIVKRVQQSRPGSDSSESPGEREARRAQRNANGMIDWVVAQLSEEFNSQREQTKTVLGQGVMQLDDAIAAIAAAFSNGLLGARHAGDRVTPGGHALHCSDWNQLELEAA